MIIFYTTEKEEGFTFAERGFGGPMEAPGAAGLAAEFEPSAIKVPEVVGSSTLGYWAAAAGVSTVISWAPDDTKVRGLLQELGQCQ